MNQIRPQYVNAANGNKDMEILALALELSITAPTEKKAQECAEMAEVIASRLNNEQVETCKAVVLEVLEQEDNESVTTLH